MSRIGLKNFKYAELTNDGVSSSTYGTVGNLGGAIESKIAVSLAEGTLYEDDAMAENDAEFVGGTITLGIDQEDDSIFAGLLGNTSAQETINGTAYSVITHKADDIAKEVGFGQIVPIKKNGARKWKAEFLPRVKFKPYDVEAKTKGSGLEYTTPSVEGAIFKNARGEWMKRVTCDNEADAIAALTAWLGSGLTVTQTLTGCTSSNSQTSIGTGNSFSAVYTADAGKALPTAISVTIGGTAATAGTDYTYNSTTGLVTVPAVSGNLVVTVSATNAD